MLYVILSIVSILVVVGALGYVYMDSKKLKKQYEDALALLVENINKVNEYQYYFDKTQETNIKNIEENTYNMDARLRNMDIKVTNATQKMNDKVTEISQGALTASGLASGVSSIKASRFDLDNLSLSQKMDDNMPWVAITDKYGKDFQGGLATQQLLVKDTVTVNGGSLLQGTVIMKGGVSDMNKDLKQTVFASATDGKNYLRGDTTMDGHLTMNGNFSASQTTTLKGGASEHNAGNLPTVFPSAGDGKNYIRGDTELQGNINNVGDLNARRNLNIGGKMFFKDASYNTTANISNSQNPMYLEKIPDNGKKSQLRLTMNDNPDVSFQIWGNSCGEVGGCSGPGAMKHMFDAAGNTEHVGNQTVGSLLSRGAITGTNIVASSSTTDVNKNAWLSAKNDSSTISIGLDNNSQGIVLNNTNPFSVYDKDGERITIDAMNTSVRSKLSAQELCVGKVCLNETELGSIKSMLAGAPTQLASPAQIASTGEVLM